ncbi:MAG TPA: hypothetical protein VFQ61_00390 [Polyangiaceae bacterium]|nr:hypothetical protein [Polyangiaceae bacterium]
MIRVDRACMVAALALSVSWVSRSHAQSSGQPVQSNPSTQSQTAAGTPSTATGASTKPADGNKTTTTGASPGAAASPGVTGGTSSGATAPSTGAAPTTAAPTTTSTTASGASGAASGGAGLDGSTYVVRLRDLEQRIDELKEQIRRSHTRLSLLSDTILSGGVGGSRAEVVFRNDLSNAFRLTGAVVVLDGVVQYNKQDDSDNGLLGSQKEIPIFSGSIPPGDHTVQVVVRLQGHGYGVFSYLRSYKFDLKASHQFTITEGKTIGLDIIAWEKGDVTTPLDQRPAVRFGQTLRSGLADPAAAGGKPAAPPPAAPSTSISGGASLSTGTK